MSLEKLPLDEVKPKRISLLVNTPESEVESHGMPLPIMRSSLDTAPSGEEDLASGEGHAHSYPTCVQLGFFSIHMYACMRHKCGHLHVHVVYCAKPSTPVHNAEEAFIDLLIQVHVHVHYSC